MFTERLMKLLEVPGREIRIYNESPRSPTQGIFNNKIGIEYNIYKITIFNYLSNDEITFSRPIHLNSQEKDLNNLFDIIEKELDNYNV